MLHFSGERRRVLTHNELDQALACYYAFLRAMGYEETLYIIFRPLTQKLNTTPTPSQIERVYIIRDYAGEINIEQR